MKLSVFGTGYVGLVTGVCFSEMGDQVTCVDIDSSKIQLLKDGQSPIYEPGLNELLQNNILSRRLKFTTNAEEAINESEILFIAVGTPPKEDGSADLSYVLEVAKQIAETMTSYKLIVNKSTVPPGTQAMVKALISDVLKKRNVNIEFDVASNPEFLREGNAIDDCLKPARIVIGVETDRAKVLLSKLYESFLKNGNPLLILTPASSEMTKYAANAMLATKISLMNEFSRLCEHIGADIEEVRKGIGSDPRIGPHFIYAGIGYGGSCFPKDVSALIQIGEKFNEDLKILRASDLTNQLQRQRFTNKIIETLGADLSKITVAIWGVAFKPGTDDIREAPALYVIEELLKQGVTINAYDPVAAKNAKTYFNGHPNLVFYDDQYEAIKNADSLIILTEWRSFKDPDFSNLHKSLRMKLVFDGRNIYNPAALAEFSLKYISIGRS